MKRELTTTQVNVNERKVWKKAERQLIDETTVVAVVS